jgi:hypothetical protein
MQDEVLRARLVTQTRVTLKSSTHHKIRLFVHANVMDVSVHKRNDCQSSTRSASLDEMIGVEQRRHSPTTGFPCGRRVPRDQSRQIRIHLSDRIDESI